MSENTQLQGIWTQYGQEKLAKWLAGGSPLAIIHAAVGNGGGSVPTVKPSQGALVSEEWRGLVNSVQVNPGDATDVIVDVVLPNNIGGFWIREWGLFDDAGKLVAVGPHAEMHKPLITSGQAAEFLERFHLPVSNTGAVTLSIATQALATQGFVTSQVAGHNVAVDAHQGFFRDMDAALMAHVIKTLEQGTHGFPMGEEGQILSVQNGRLVWIDPCGIRYDIAQYYPFQDEMVRTGHIPLLGLWVDNFSRYPKAVEYFGTSHGLKRLVTLDEYNARHVATWATLADGKTIGWEGEGGVNVFVWDKVNDKLLVPDLAGMSWEQTCAALGVGGVHGDALPRALVGSAGGVHTSGGGATGVFKNRGGFWWQTTTQNYPDFYSLGFDAANVYAVTNKNQIRAYGSLACEYLGVPAS